MLRIVVMLRIDLTWVARIALLMVMFQVKPVRTVGTLIVVVIDPSHAVISANSGSWVACGESWLW